VELEIFTSAHGQGIHLYHERGGLPLKIGTLVPWTTGNLTVRFRVMQMEISWEMGPQSRIKAVQRAENTPQQMIFLRIGSISFPEECTRRNGLVRARSRINNVTHPEEIAGAMFT
jgi:hypothetical protein